MGKKGKGAKSKEKERKKEGARECIRKVKERLKGRERKSVEQ